MLLFLILIFLFFLSFFIQNYVMLILSIGGLVWLFFFKNSKTSNTDEISIEDFKDPGFLDTLAKLSKFTPNKAVKKACGVILAYISSDNKKVESSAYEVNKSEESSRQHGNSEDLPVVPTPPEVVEVPKINLEAAFNSLKNINIFLYLGAFFIVVAAGILVSYNYEQLSGISKTILLGFFALAFYLAGILLYVKTKKIRPAGLTFTGIGLVLIPLVGLGAYNFIFMGQHGNYVWFATSLVTLAF